MSESIKIKKDKSMFIAYLFLLFLGVVGGHRFYLKRYKSAVIIMILFFIFEEAIIFWLLIDAFLIPEMVRQYNQNFIGEIQ